MDHTEDNTTVEWVALHSASSRADRDKGWGRCHLDHHHMLGTHKVSTLDRTSTHQVQEDLYDETTLHHRLAFFSVVVVVVVAVIFQISRKDRRQ